MMNKRKTHFISSLIAAALCGWIGMVQLLPFRAEALRGKSALLPVVAAVVLTGAVYLFWRELFRRWEIPGKVLRVIRLLSLALGLLIVGLYHMSLPQKEFFLPRHSVRIQAEGPAAFLSLNNGYRGVSFGEFATEGDWERQGEALVLTGDSGSLSYDGFHGALTELYFQGGERDALIRAEWGDGAADSLTLSAGSEPVGLSHPYGGTRPLEWVNFLFNLIPVWTLMSALFELWLLFQYLLLRVRSVRFRRVFTVLTCCVIFMRLYNVYDFPLCWDEGTYARASMQYTEKIRSFRWLEMPDILYNHEHPAFVKLMYALPGVMDGRTSFEYFGLNHINHAHGSTEDYAIFTSRLVASAFSVITMQFLTAFFHPLAGFFWLIHSYAEAYGAQTRLEAIPMLTSLLSVWCFLRMLRALGRQDIRRARWCLLGASLTLGMTAASKFIYCVIVIPMILCALESLIRGETRFRDLAPFMVGMAVLSLSAFYVCNPSVWKHPIERLGMEFSFHGGYEEGHKDLYPWWYSVCWVTRSIAHQSGVYFEKSPLAVNPQHFFFSCDELIFLLAVIGVRDLFRRQRVFVYWFITAMIFLFCWGTKWEQYTCITTVPIILSAVHGTVRCAQFIVRSEE